MMSSSSDSFHPIQLKGEIMDLEFNVDTDHRKRRRNRTTQSCLNCHTSKRKCDRKRPCSRCIQLGLTGLCVYEIDDPALRDDPSLDENTRLRNRIAELESLVRELRGKPHPRWADNNFRDGDPNEKWHSRATKCAPLHKRDEPGGRNGRPHPMVLSPIKTEPSAEAPNPNLYRFSPSPGPTPRYQPFDVRRTSSNSSFESANGQGRPQNGQSNHAPYNSPTSAIPLPYSSSSNGNGNQYNGHSNGSNYSDSGSNGYGPLANSDEGYNDQFSPNTSTPQGYCPCRSSSSTAVAYVSLCQHLQNSLASLRQFTHHPPNNSCLLYRRVSDLNELIRDAVDHPAPNNPPSNNSHYDSNTPSDNELLTPLSASSSGGGHPHFQGSSGSPGMPPQEWSNIGNGNYNPYFPMPPAEHHGVYTHVMS